MYTYEVRPRKDHRGVDIRSNQSMKPTQPFVAATEIMRSLVFKVLGGLSLSR
jgi:hypothetical protein